MVLRFVLSAVTACCLLPVNAQEMGADVKGSNITNSNQSFGASPNPAVMGNSRQDARDGIVPPPPGPYVSSALTNNRPSFSGSAFPSFVAPRTNIPASNARSTRPGPGPIQSGSVPAGNARTNNNQEASVQQSAPSPLRRPNGPWPVQQFQQNMWGPNSTTMRAPQMQSRPPMMNQPPVSMRMPVPNNMYRNNSPHTNHPGSFIQPQMVPPNANRQPMWKPFNVPMSNYPYSNRRSVAPAPR